MPGSVFDSYALLVFLFGQKGKDRVAGRLEAAALEEQPIRMAAPNWAEVRYMVERKAGAAQWPEVRNKLRALPIEIVPADEGLAEQAGALKANHRMSLADCFAAALAQLRKADLYTGDPEFRAVEKEIRIIWI